METIKSYTDFEQSKKLAEILPLENADMFWRHCNLDNLDYPIMQTEFEYIRNANTPCWSLASLLNVLPNNENISTNLSKGGYKLSTLEYTNSWFVDYEDETDGLNNCVTSADNPVDACVAMIEKLNELNLL